ncbi:uncharacterized protein LOC115889821 [Sitophilus oryzae]|uniref:Uncharacterized protein LOC115889821 n=1 Tax=Sitophilus oryzae TaxID=7048 RepID=A0A6J2YR51_SITOR|nr:uncharacterized protein LOC115889821 [Sitophilus oryzae]
MDKVTKSQRSMERQMLHIRLVDRKRNEWIRGKLKYADDTVVLAESEDQLQILMDKLTEESIRSLEINTVKRKTMIFDQASARQSKQRHNDLIANIYSEATTTIKIHEGTKPIFIGGVRQGDTISPKLFNQALEDVFKNLDWEEKAIKICGQYLNHLRYADDIALITEKKEELIEMLEELDSGAGRIGLNMNYTKTKIITNTDENITTRINQEKIEQIEEYIYLGQMIKLKKENRKPNS